MSDRGLKVKKDLSLETPLFDPEEEIEIEKKERKLLCLLVFFAFMISVTISFFAYYSINKKFLEDEKQKDLLVLGEETEKKDANAQFDPVRKIAYINSENVWIYDLHENRNMQITSDGVANYIYSSLAWRNKSQLSFSKCNSQKCIIQTYDVHERTIAESFEVDGQNVFAVRWSYKGDKLAYLFEKDGELYLTVKSNDVFKNLGKFSYDSNKIEDYNDSIYIRFSPSDESLMLVNTYVNVDDSPIVVINLDGEVILSADATFGFFTSDKTIYYKKDDHIFVRSLENDTETQLTDRIVGAFNFQPSPDKSKITYWTFDWVGGVSTVWTYEIGSDKIKRLKDFEAFPVWVDNDTLISLKLKVCNKCPKRDLEFENFIKTDLNTKASFDVIGLDDLREFSAGNF